MLAFAWSLWRPHRWLIPPLVALTVLNAITVAALPLAIKGVYDLLARGLTPEPLRQGVLWVAAVGMMRFVAYTTLQNLRAWMNIRLEWHIRSRVFAHLVGLGPSFFGRYRTGDLITRLTTDAGDERLSWFLCSGIFRALEALCVVVTVSAAMLRLDARLALYCLLPLPVLFGVFVAVSSRLSERFQRQQKAISAVNSQLEATFSGIRLIKACALEGGRRAAFADDLERRRAAELDATRGMVLMENVYGYSWQITAATVLLLGGRMVIAGDISLGDFVAFNGFALSLTFPMFDLGSFLTKGRQAVVAVERLRELETFAPDVADAAAVPAGQRNGLAFEGDGIDFRYEGATRPALDDVALRVRRGDLLAVTGRVGEGKSTLLRLLLRLMDPQGGTLRRDGADLRDVPLDRARGGTAWVPQDPVIFSSTIFDNIRFGRDAITREDADWAVRMAHLAPDLEGFAEGLDTFVGPRGTQLSGGQKQRLSLARALAGRPEILLLDDCTASLDAATEAALWTTLRETLPHATIVLVTHRTAALQMADAVLVLGDGGRVVESGAHADLMALGAVYAGLFRRWQAQEA